LEKILDNYFHALDLIVNIWSGFTYAAMDILGKLPNMDYHRMQVVDSSLVMGDHYDNYNIFF